MQHSKSAADVLEVNGLSLQVNTMQTNNCHARLWDCCPKLNTPPSRKFASMWYLCGWEPELEQLLNDVELRVLGSLIEKEKTTPEYYPLSLNALTNACNQSSNRDPVVHFDEDTVVHALDTLRDKQLVRMVDRG